ncbi:methenyltetrahydromethanopterin cyclohydrolase [Thiorhodococcus fuscus]|uniref:Methenyltetrahydromethanopterin cyclohydrolase n=1 Tax=Thiorhodococcus fuscus TaxID=527200 RepID=A0ABW4YEU4_9GAMM
MIERRPSLNALVSPLVDALVADADWLRLEVRRLENGAQLIDAGISALGGLEAGRRISEICLGGLSRVRLSGSGPVPGWPSNVEVSAADPVLACLGSQYAGWSLTHGEGKGAFHALGSGPGRALAGKEPLFAELRYRDRSERACLVLEVDKEPPLPLVDKIASECGVDPSALTLILTPTSSLVGTVQIVSRVLEVALHKTHELGFDLDRIHDGMGSAPLPPPSPDFVTAMGRTNDAILFGGQVHLFLGGRDDVIEELAERLPSSASRDYGRPFAEVFKAYDYDFFQVDPLLFSPARILLTAVESGRTFAAGRIDLDLLAASFGIAP